MQEGKDPPRFRLTRFTSVTRSGSPGPFLWQVTPSQALAESAQVLLMYSPLRFGPHQLVSWARFSGVIVLQ